MTTNLIIINKTVLKILSSSEHKKINLRAQFCHQIGRLQLCRYSKFKHIILKFLLVILRKLPSLDMSSQNDRCEDIIVLCIDIIYD